MSSVAEGELFVGSRAQASAEVWVLIAANAVIALGYGVVAPVLPQFARNFGVSISAATFVITAFALMRLCFAPASGMLVQRLGERRIYVSGLIIVALSTGACAFAHTYWQLLVFRALGWDRLDDVLRLRTGADDPDQSGHAAAGWRACLRRRSWSARWPARSWAA